MVENQWRPLHLISFEGSVNHFFLAYLSFLGKNLYVNNVYSFVEGGRVAVGYLAPPLITTRKVIIGNRKIQETDLLCPFKILVTNWWFKNQSHFWFLLELITVDSRKCPDFIIGYLPNSRCNSGSSHLRTLNFFPPLCETRIGRFFTRQRSYEMFA